MSRALRSAALLALALSACDDQYHIQNLAPVVAVVGYCQDADRYYLKVRVRDPERDPVDIEIRTADGAKVLPTGAAGDGVEGLRSERTAQGVVHLVEWASTCEALRCLDEEAACPCAARPESPADSIRLQVKGTDGADLSATATSNELPLTDTCAD